MAIGVNIVSNFDAKGISKAIKSFNKLDGASAKGAFALGTLDKSATSMVKGLAKAATGLGIVAGAIGFKLAAAAYESQKVMAQTEAIIKATGGAAGITADHVQRLSDKLSMQIGVDDELIQTSANLLLTFKQISNQMGEGNQIFDRAVIAAQDLGSVFGSADAAAMQLGKALANPVAGITALRRAGINFTEQQQEQIKTLVASGKSLEAQKLILAEVESQVGGTAAASATGFDKMRVALGNVAENAGKLLLPVIERFANFVINNVVPYLNTLINVLGNQGVGGLVQRLGSDFLNLTTNMGTFGNVILGVIAMFTALRLVMIAATISQQLFNVALFSNPIGLIVAAVILLIVGLAALYLKFESVRKVVNILGQIIKFVVMNAIAGLINYFVTFINIAIKGINLLIKAANMFGAGISEIGELGYMAFTKFGDAAQEAAVEVRNLGNIAGAMQAKEGGTQLIEPFKKVKEIIIGTGAAVKTLIEKLKDYKDAALGLVDAQTKLADSTQGIVDAQFKVVDATLAVGDAFRNIGKAQNDVTKATRDLKKAQDDVGKAIANVADAVLDTTNAQNKLQKATNGVTKAQQAFDDAVRGYGATSKQGMTASDQLAESQRNLEGNGYDLETAQFRVIDAETELAAVRANAESTARDIREAEINLAESKLSLTEAQRQQKKSQDEVTDSTSQYDQMVNGVLTTSDLYKQLLDDLNEAKAIEKEATDAVTEARLKEADAALAVSDALLAESEAVIAVEDAKIAVTTAIREHEKALFDEAAAIREVAKATLEEAQALLAVAEAQNKVNAARKNAPAADIKKVDTAIAGVVAAAKAAVAGVATATATGASASATGLSEATLLELINRRAMADGGIVTKPTMRLLGERGPEAVIPLSNANTIGGTTINVTVNAGLGANSSSIGDAVVDALQKYQRRNGSVPITVSG